MSFNKAIIVGNIGQDIDLRKTKSGDSVCELSVATNEKYKDKEGNWQSNTEWHSVQVFGRNADNCAQYLRKGSKVLVEGKIKTRKWEDKNGFERKKTEIVARFIEFMDPKGDRPVDSAKKPTNEQVRDFGDNNTVDYIPF